MVDILCHFKPISKFKVYFKTLNISLKLIGDTFFLQSFALLPNFEQAKTLFSLP